jgi:peptidyl-prolyl cis-trans isomerase A (cyclophilin A)
MTFRSLAVAAIALSVTVAAAAQTAAPAGSARGGQGAQGAKLRNPAALTEKAPATYKVKIDTSAGPFVVQVHRDWAPNGADRFYNLVKAGFYDDVRFFRVIPNFMVQFGINGTPSVATIWSRAQIKDDPVKQSNKRGYITFATAGPNTRTTQVFINFKDNTPLDAQGFAPFGEVVDGMSVVDKLYSQYAGKPQEQFVKIQTEGNAFLNKEFPKLDYIKKATIEPE